MQRTLIILCLISFNTTAAVARLKISNDNIYIGFLAEYSQMRVTLGGLPLAVENVNKDPTLLPGKRLIFKAFDIGQPKNNYHVQPLRIMTRMRDEGVAAFIGPDESCTSEALLSSAWNLPMLSFKCSDSVLSNKETFSTFARTLAPASKVSKSVISLLEAFHWHKFSIVYSSKPFWGLEVARAIQSLAISENITVTHFKDISDYIPMDKTISKMQTIVDETYATTRREQFVLIDFLRCLQNRKLLLDGNYMIISVDDEIYDSKRRVHIMERNYLDPYIRKEKSKSLDMNSFLSVIKISMSFPQNPKIREICDKIKEYARKPPFSVPYHERVFDNISVPLSGLHLYDSIMIYARALTDLLSSSAHKNIYNGSAVMAYIFNHSYHSIQGFDVHIDANGDAEGNYTVITLQSDSNNGNNNNNSGSLVKMTMQPVGYFVYNKQSHIPEFRYIKPDSKIKWLKGRPPLAEPICGFYNELCQIRKPDLRYMLLTAFFGFLILIAAFLLIKHYRYEQTLASLLWKVDMKDVTILNVNSISESDNYKIKNIYQICRQSLLLSGDNNNKKSFTNIALYRGNIVAMKKVYKKSVDITRSVRKELKQMRDLHHENIIAFIGVSIDPGSVTIFTGYCARGSLEEVLGNNDINLDHIFISSLVSDILKGLIYLHDSEIVSHGNLRSSNCLIDSRWICQVSDFGLHEFKNGQIEPCRKSLELRRSLWRAPELLRDYTSLPRGTQKGDVYAFGIVLYEIIGRKGPWGETKYTNEEIIALVKQPQLLLSGIFRPPTAQIGMPDYIRQCLFLCWEEDPEIRPDIRLVRVKLKPLQAGLKSNIFDNMLSIMEKYAFNLESLVQARTNQLCEEKKKTDMLLYQMLPRSVAESLKRGKPVEAECFDCVTIMFSDIVGFTELCSTSTPFQVVEMLNDLYTCCDSIISNYDVYKVETIGDAYMVVSGLPLRNGNRHAGEIASLALHMLEMTANLQIRHRPNNKLKFRIGIHSGSCAAGVIGLKMPRYCLFGDTVNTAARLESTGKTMKIHVSESTHKLLELIGGYQFQERGLTNLKGKGDMRTYWLIGRNANYVTAPDLIRNMELEAISNATANKTSNNAYLKLNRTTYCCKCATKVIYNRRSDDNVAVTTTQTPTNTTTTTTTTTMQAFRCQNEYTMCQLCVCQLQNISVNNLQYKPRSAPSISFRL